MLLARLRKRQVSPRTRKHPQRAGLRMQLQQTEPVHRALLQMRRKPVRRLPLLVLLPLALLLVC